MFNVNTTNYSISMSKGDTGTIQINTVTEYTFAAEDRAVFTVKNSSGEIVKEVISELTENGGTFTVSFLNDDTDHLATGAYSWDIRYVLHPYYDSAGKIVNGDQVITPMLPMTLNLLNVVGEV